MDTYQELAQNSQRDNPKKMKNNKIQPGPVDDQYEQDMDNIVKEANGRKGKHQYKASIASMGNELGGIDISNNQQSVTISASEGNKRKTKKVEQS